MTVDKSYFSTGVSAFFEMATADAERILPDHLEPIEVRPQRSILNVTVFHFSGTEVGSYVELMLSIVVPPVVDEWGRHPKGAFFPFQAATSSEASRLHRRSLLRIPHFEEDIDAQFIEKEDRVRVQVWGGGSPILDLTVYQHRWQSTTHLLHAFMMDGPLRLKADLQISGRYTVHEHERGEMTLHEHPMTRQLTLGEVSPQPFREHWLKEGFELFHPVEAL